MYNFTAFIRSSYKHIIWIYLNQARVIEPPELIERICSHCNQLLEQYKEV